MKKTIILCTALLAGGSSLTAADGAPATSEATYAVTADFPYVTKYVFRGVKIARDSIQPSVEVAAGDFYAGVWNNTPLRNEHDGHVSKELDLYAGYTPKLTDNLKADLGATYYWYPSVDRPVESHSLEVFGGLNLIAGNFTPGVYVYRDLHLDSWTVQGSVGYSVPLKSWGTSLDFNASIGAVSPDHGEAYDYYSLGVNLPVKLSDALKLNLGLTYTENDLDHKAGSTAWKDPGLSGTAGITASF